MTNGRGIFGLCAVAVLMAGIAASPARAAGEDIYAEVNRGVALHHILPRYEALKRRTRMLDKDVEILCRAVTTESLGRARRSFHRAMDAWQGVQHVRFGPIERNNRHPRIQFWPDRRDRVGKHLARLIARADPKTLEPAAFAAGSVAVQGFPALEQAVFGAADPLASLRGPNGTGYRCAVAKAIARNLAAIAAALEREWAEIAGALKKTPQPTTVEGVGKRDRKDVTSAIFNDLVTAFGSVKDLKLGGPLGVKTGRVHAYLAENGQSKRSLVNVAANFAAMADLYGVLVDALPEAWRKTPQQAFIRSQFQKLVSDIRSFGPSLVDVLADDDQARKLKILMFGIGDLRDLVIADLVETLDLTVGFNALDGD